MKIGTWTIIDQWTVIPGYHKKVRVICECGFEAIRYLHSIVGQLKKGYKGRCQNCFYKTIYQDVSNKTFGNRTVIRDFFKDWNHWAETVCICGSVKIIKACLLVTNKALRCNECRKKRVPLLSGKSWERNKKPH